MSADEDFSRILKRLSEGSTLDADESALAFGAIMEGNVPPSRIAAFLTALAVRKPTVDEIVGGVRIMRSKMMSIKAPPGCIDLCGTGGDGQNTLNISTATALVVAGSGVAVAKHGNRSMSSRSGTADVLELLGVKIDLAPAEAERCLNDAGICFLFAPSYHAAMKHVATVRRELGFRTVFNLLGPLSNPAHVKRQLVGVFSREWIDTLAKVLLALGTEKAWIVNGEDGLDELTTTAETHVAMLQNGVVTHRTVAPEDAGLKRSPLSAIRGGDVPENAKALLELLEGAKGAYRDIVLLNSAAALIIADKAPDLRTGAEVAAQSLDNGRARDALARLVAFSHGIKP